MYLLLNLKIFLVNKLIINFYYNIILGYISNHAEKYNLLSLSPFGIIPGIFVKNPSSLLPTFCNDISHYFDYIILIFMKPEINIYYLDIYFIIIRIPKEDIYLNEEMKQKHSLNQIASFISESIKKIISQALLDYLKDDLWNRMVLFITKPQQQQLIQNNMTISNSQSLSSQIPIFNRIHFLKLLSLISKKLIEEIDPSLKLLFTLENISWSSLMVYLQTIYGKNSAILSNEEETYLIILFPTYNDDIMIINKFIHIIFYTKQKNIQIFACNKEGKSMEEEDEQISTVINHILYFLWKLILK